MEKLDSNENELPTTTVSLRSESHRPGVKIEKYIFYDSFIVKFHKWPNKYVPLEIRALVSLKGKDLWRKGSRMVPSAVLIIFCFCIWLLLSRLCSICGKSWGYISKMYSFTCIFIFLKHFKIRLISTSWGYHEDWFKRHLWNWSSFNKQSIYLTS